MSDEVEEFVSRFPRQLTPRNSVEYLFEIQHTGERSLHENAAFVYRRK